MHMFTIASISGRVPADCCPRLVGISRSTVSVARRPRRFGQGRCPWARLSLQCTHTRRVTAPSSTRRHGAAFALPAPSLWP
eukprot:13513433-Alexandrium_andersonii.AAC.1